MNVSTIYWAEKNDSSFEIKPIKDSQKFTSVPNLWVHLNSHTHNLLVLDKSFFKGLFTRREGYPSKRVNPSWRAKR